MRLNPAWRPAPGRHQDQSDCAGRGHRYSSDWAGCMCAHRMGWGDLYRGQHRSEGAWQALAAMIAMDLLQLDDFDLIRVVEKHAD